MSETQDNIQFEITQRFQVSLTPEEKLGLKNALNRTMEDHAFYNALVQDPHKALSEFGLNPNTIATLVDMAAFMVGVPPLPPFPLPLPPHIPPPPPRSNVTEGVQDK